MFLIAINGDFTTQVRNITAAFIYNNKGPPRSTKFQPYDLECKYAIFSGIV